MCERTQNTLSSILFFQSGNPKLVSFLITFYSSLWLPLAPFPSPRETLTPMPSCLPHGLLCYLAYLQVLLVEKHDPRELERKSRSQRFMGPFGVTKGETSSISSWKREETFGWITQLAGNALKILHLFLFILHSSNHFSKGSNKK